MQTRRALVGLAVLVLATVPLVPSAAAAPLNANGGATEVVSGTSTPRGYLRVITSPAVAGRISVDGVPRNNWGMWTDLPVGAYRVCFGPVAGFNPPACQNATVNAGVTSTVTGTYTVNASAPGATGVGYLRVTSNPAVPTQISLNGVVADSWGLNWVELAPGQYTVNFSHVDGYTEPVDQTVTITARATTTVAGTFTPVRTPAPSGIPVPASVDATGATDASAALNSWVRSVPNGSTIVFKARGYYRMDTALVINGRQNLTFEGNGATLKSNGDYREASSVFRVFGCTNIVIRNITLVGNSPTPGVNISGKQGAHGVQIAMGSNIEIANTTISNVYGDAVNSNYDTNGVWVHNSTINRPGRGAVVVLSGMNWLVENNVFNNTSNSSAIVDIEPYEASGHVHGFIFRSNTINGNNFYFAANAYRGASAGAITDITITGNTATNGTIRGLIWATTSRPQRVTITNNRALGPAVAFYPDSLNGGGLELRHIDGLTVTGNQVTFSPPHALATIVDCTGVTYP